MKPLVGNKCTALMGCTGGFVAAEGAAEPTHSFSVMCEGRSGVKVSVYTASMRG